MGRGNFNFDGAEDERTRDSRLDTGDRSRDGIQIRWGGDDDPGGENGNGNQIPVVMHACMHLSVPREYRTYIQYGACHVVALRDERGMNDLILRAVIDIFTARFNVADAYILTRE